MKMLKVKEWFRLRTGGVKVGSFFKTPNGESIFKVTRLHPTSSIVGVKVGDIFSCFFYPDDSIQPLTAEEAEAILSAQ